MSKHRKECNASDGYVIQQSHDSWGGDVTCYTELVDFPYNK